MLAVHRSQWSVFMAAVVTALSLSGCTGFSEYVHNGFKVGPNYCRPPAPAPQHWIDVDDVRSGPPEDLSRWWTVLRDPVLDHLIACAYRQNLSLREAGFRILQARAQRGIVVGELFPQSQSGFADYRRVAQSSAFFDRWDFGFNLAWELDFWGRFRRAVIAADRQLEASVEDYDNVLVTLLADVASNYITIRTDQERIRYARENIEIQRPAVEYWQAREKAGFGTDPKVNLESSLALLKLTEAQIPPLEIDMRQANDALCVLMGIPAVDLRQALDIWKAEDQRKQEEVRRVEDEIRRAQQSLESVHRTPEPATPEQKRQADDDVIHNRIEELRRTINIVYIPTSPNEQQMAVGIPAQLLARRPDVRRAERLAAAQAELIGIAASDLYPAISVNGTLGYQAPTLSQLFSSRALTGNIGPSLQWNILNYGRLLNNIRLQDARFQELVTTYQRTLLNADQEVEDGLIKFGKEQEHVVITSDSVRHYSAAIDYMYQQLAVGRIDYGRYYPIARDRVPASDAMATAYGQQIQGLILVYRALGGGWEIRLEGQPPAPGAPPAENVPAAEPLPPPPANVPPQQGGQGAAAAAAPVGAVQPAPPLPEPGVGQKPDPNAARRLPPTQ